MRILDLIPAKELSRVAKLQLLAQQVVEGFCSGRHRSHHKGLSVEFKEHRPYVPGDELSNIDWKVFGKSDRLYIRESEEDTNLRCTLILDRSGSMLYCGERSGGRSKYDYAQLLAASLAYLMLGQQDAVGVITFDDEAREFVPCRSRPSHLKAIMTALAKKAGPQPTDLAGVFTRIAPRFGRRGLLIILTDAMGDVASLGRALAQARASKHEVLLLQIIDPDEVDFPFSGRIQFRDLENSVPEQAFDASTLRRAYLKRFAEQQATLRDVCRKHRVEWIQLSTDQPMADALHDYLAARRRIR